jgi:hypothetical protein
MSMVGFDSGRAEHKYVVSETTALALRSFMKAYLMPDQYMPAGSPEGYHVHSLYLDSPAYELYHETKDGVKNRYKLRMRFYDDSREAPTFLEIKTRTTDSIRKHRAIISKQAAENFLSGGSLTPADLIGGSNKAAYALTDFGMRTSRLAARGSVFVSYQREAYVALEADGIRVTFDRHITGKAYDPLSGLQLPADGAAVFPDQVVFEVKYSGPIPSWIRGLIHDFGLQRVSFPKYVHAVDALQQTARGSTGELRGVAC